MESMGRVSKYRYTKISDFKNHHSNPFLDKLVEGVDIVEGVRFIKSKGSKGVQQMIVNDIGEVMGYSSFLQFVETDRDRFVKLYLSQLSTLWNLSKPAIRVFTYIISILRPNKDEFYFFMSDCLEYTGYASERSIIEGLTDLIEAGIIARGKDNIRYYINPLVVFNGNRVRFIKTHIKKIGKGVGGKESEGGKRYKMDSKE